MWRPTDGSMDEHPMDLAITKYCHHKVPPPQGKGADIGLKEALSRNLELAMILDSALFVGLFKRVALSH